MLTLTPLQVVFAVSAFVKENLGQSFIESPPTDLQTLYQDINNITPLVFVLSTGSDPMGSLLRFAGEMNVVEKYVSLKEIFILAKYTYIT